VINKYAYDRISRINSTLPIRQERSEAMRMLLLVSLALTHELERSSVMSATVERLTRNV